jgi:hypothetical protein
MKGNMDGMEINMESMKDKMDDIENKMEENNHDLKREIKNSMENVYSLIFQAIDERFPKETSKGNGLMKIKVALMLNKLPIIIHLVNLTLIVELILVGVLNSTFSKLN